MPCHPRTPPGHPPSSHDLHTIPQHIYIMYRLCISAYMQSRFAYSMCMNVSGYATYCIKSLTLSSIVSSIVSSMLELTEIRRKRHPPFSCGSPIAFVLDRGVQHGHIWVSDGVLPSSGSSTSKIHVSDDIDF